MEINTLALGRRRPTVRTAVRPLVCAVPQCLGLDGAQFESSRRARRLLQLPTLRTVAQILLRSRDVLRAGMRRVSCMEAKDLCERANPPARLGEAVETDEEKRGGRRTESALAQGQNRAEQGSLRATLLTGDSR